MQLITYPQAHGLFAPSPFCVKAAYLLNLSGQEWTREDLNDPRKMPFGKLPVLRADGRLIPDSDGIRNYLEDQGAEFDAGLSALDRANARAFIRMAEEHLYFHLIQDRWGNDEIWPILRETYFGGLPKVVMLLTGGLLRKQVLSGLKYQGTGRFAEHERVARVRRDLEAVTARLEATPFLFGDAPTSADASVGAMLQAMATSPKPTALSGTVSENKVLADYIMRVDAACS